MNKVTGSLQPKNNRWQMVIAYYVDDKRKQISRTTGLKAEKKNRKQAEVMLDELIHEYRNKYNLSAETIFFHKYIKRWYEEIIINDVRPQTYKSYEYQILKGIIPYFEKQKILLKDLRPKDIQGYYNYMIKEGLSAKTVSKHHANIHKCLRYAVFEDLIPYNPADSVQLPKKEKFHGNYYEEDELAKLFKAVEGHKMEVPVKLAALFGLRRGEAVGITWEQVDFEKKILRIDRTCIMIGNQQTNDKKTKNESSNREFPLNDEMIAFFKKLKNQQRQKKMAMFGQTFKESDFLCINENGDQLKLDYVSHTFASLLTKNKLRKIRFHELRHSCASRLLNTGSGLHDVAQFLGHSDISTTSNIYGHLSQGKKKQMLDTMTTVCNL